ncbi:MAG: thermonuclease family protein [Armatimonadota bacterium]|nr:thermonuclease family protein [Armatimonadota bacterium]MCX7777778.1 thermonuclease family protein [Armatimonadota bacterium]MDW8025335.1 thermonuclease family protein [Armatimonadota bacterium]
MKISEMRKAAPLSCVWLIALMVQLALAQQRAGVYKCLSVEAPNTLKFEKLGTVTLIGVKSPAAADPGFESAMQVVRRYAEGKSLKVEPCPIRPKDDEGKLRAIVYFREANTWHNLNTKLLRAGYAMLQSEERCHVNVKAWVKFVAQAQSQGRGLWARLQPERQIETDYVMALHGLRVAETVARAPRAYIGVGLLPATPERMSRVGEALLPLGPALRESYQALGNITSTEYVQLRTLVDARERCLTLENALRTGVPIRALNPRRLMELFIERDLPAPTNALTAPVRDDRGRTIWEAMQQLYLTDAREPLHEILFWFPGVQSQFRNRLIALGAQLVGGPMQAAPTGVAAPMGAPPGGMPGAPPGGMPGAPMGAPPTGLGAAGAPAAAPAGGLQSYYELLGRIRARRVEPEEACLLMLALRTYRREFLEDEIDRAKRRYEKAVEQQRKFEAFMQRQLQRTTVGR